MADARVDQVVRCLLGAEPHEVVTAVRGTRPRRLEILGTSGATVLARLTTSLGTGVELGLMVEVMRVESGSRLAIAPAVPGGSRLEMVAASALLDVVEGSFTTNRRAVAATG